MTTRARRVTGHGDGLTIDAPRREIDAVAHDDIRDELRRFKMHDERLSGTRTIAAPPGACAATAVAVQPSESQATASSGVRE